MFDVGFSEMIVIAVVALIVIGPEKLPRVARTVGALIGRMQRYVNDVKADINREIELDELKKMHTSVKDAVQSVESSVRDTMTSFESQATVHATELNTAVSSTVNGDAPAPAPEISNQELEAAIAAADAQGEAYAVPLPEEPSPQASLFGPEPEVPVHGSTDDTVVVPAPSSASPAAQSH